MLLPWARSLWFYPNSGKFQLWLEDQQQGMHGILGVTSKQCCGSSLRSVATLANPQPEGKSQALGRASRGSHCRVAPGGDMASGIPPRHLNESDHPRQAGCDHPLSLPFAENLSTEVSLLELIGDPPPEEILKIYGPDNNPGYVFGPNANTGQVARYHLPSPFYRDFSLLFHIQPTTPRGGVLFAVTDSSQSIIYVGVKLSELQAGKQKIIFYYTEPGSPSSYAAATFTVPTLLNQWTRFAISVEEDEVILYLDCEEHERVRFERSPDEMELEDGSGLFVAQAGGADPDKYQVRPQVTPRSMSKKAG